MIEIPCPEYIFCPFCGRQLETRVEEHKNRRYCSQCKWTYYPRVAASVMAIVTKERRVLLVKRRRDPFQGTWMFPSGFVDFGEHPEEALARELFEETGLTTKAAELLGVFQSPDDFREPGHFVFAYHADVEPGEVTNDPHENDAIDWFDLDALPEISWRLHQEFIVKLRSGSSLSECHFDRTVP